MNVQKVISSMKRELPEIRDSIVKTTPVYRVLRNRYLHKDVISLALALGEDRLLRHLNCLSLEKDFMYMDDDYYDLKMFNYISESDFFKSIYMELLGKKIAIYDAMSYGDVEVHIETDYEINRPYRGKYIIPKISFTIPTRTITITRGEMWLYRPEQYKDLELPL